MNSKKQLPMKPELKLRKLQYKYGGKHGLKQDMLRRLKHHKVPPSPSNIPEIGNKILVHGYIRENEIVLEHGLFIPYYLKEIIVKYCKSGVIAFCLTTKIPNYLFIADINNQISNKRCKAKIININENISNKGITVDSSLIAANSIKLPPTIFNSIQQHQICDTNDFNALFLMNNKCTMYLIQKYQIDKLDKNAVVFRWNLPIFDTFMKENVCVYENEYGLISFYGGKIRSLSFKSDEYLQQNDWKWYGYQQSATYRYFEASCIMITTDDHKKKLFVCGGSGSLNTSDLYDFVDKKLSSNKGDSGSCNSGICYDRMGQMVFVGGGQKKWWDHKYPRGRYGGMRSYDLMKNEWCTLPNTWNDYEYRPTMWLNESNPNILFIASTKEDSMEYIDLRQNERHWKVIRSPTYGKYDDSLADMFGLKGFASSKDANSFVSKLCVAKY